MIDQYDQYDQYVERIHELTDKLEAAEKRERMLCSYIDKALYAESGNERLAILEEALNAAPAQTEAWWHNKMVDEMETLPVADYIYIYANEIIEGETFGTHELRHGEKALDTIKLYAIPKRKEVK